MHDGVEQEWVDRVALAGFDDVVVDVRVPGGEAAERWVYGQAGELYEAFGLRLGRGLNLDGVGEVEVIDLILGRGGCGCESKNGENLERSSHSSILPQWLNFYQHCWPRRVLTGAIS